MKLKPYPKCKDSGIEWLGEVPEHWLLNRVGRVCRLQGGYAFNSELYGDEGAYLIQMSNLKSGSIEPDENRRVPIDSIPEGFILKPNNLLYGMSGSIGNYATVPETDNILALNQRVGRFIMSTELEQKYMFYFIQSDAFDTQVRLMMTGTAQFNISSDQIHRIDIAIPRTIEQQDIVSFLDRETSRIDALIQKKERMIELLKEKRIALITQAVTKGLDPTVPMKDSGIEWLGEVPEHWEIKKLRYITTRIQTGCTPPTSVEEYYDSGTVDWFGPSSFNDSLYLNDPVKLINQKAIDDGSARLFTKGTIMLIGIGATIGKIAQITQDASCNQQITAITMKAKRVNPDYATYQLKLLEDTIRGIAPSATLAIFDQSKISDLSIVLPPKKEQDDIVDQLTHDVGQNKELEVRIQSSITLLREYRSSLINAAVTGKIDLREAL